MSPDRFYAENLGLVHQVASRAYPRFQAMGAGMDYNDLVQEISIIFLKSYEMFDPDAGFTFATYFFSSAMRRVNKLAEGVELERVGVHSSSKRSKEGKWEKSRKQVHAGCSSIEEMSKNMDEGTVLDLIPSGAPSPEDELHMKQMLERFAEQLSPLALLLVECALNPPEFIERELAAISAHAEHARGQGFPRRSRGDDVTLGFVAQVLSKVTGVQSSALIAARKEIEKVAKWVTC